MKPSLDLDLLRNQIEFLDSYPWREETDRDYVEGVINLLEAVLDRELDRKGENQWIKK